INPYHGGAGNFPPADVGNVSTSQLVAALAPGARVVKALNNLTVRNLEADPIVNGARRVAFVSADDDGAKKQVETLLVAGFRRTTLQKQSRNCPTSLKMRLFQNKRMKG